MLSVYSCTVVYNTPFPWAPAALRRHQAMRFNLRANIFDYNKLYNAGFLASILGASCLCGGASIWVWFCLGYVFVDAVEVCGKI
jgi:hypothetical protein